MAEAFEQTAYILVAEDNPADVYLVREALTDRQLTLRLEVVSDGLEAVQFADQLDSGPAKPCPELLLLDFHLPKRGGDEILKHWRASKRCNEVPIVIFTSSSDPRDPETAVHDRATYYFRKPSTLEQFMELGDLVKTIVERNPVLDESE